MQYFDAVIFILVDLPGPFVSRKAYSRSIAPISAQAACVCVEVVLLLSPSEDDR